jgi:hypothetical protein
MAEDKFEVVTIETEQPGRPLKITRVQHAAERLAKNWPAAHRGALYRKAVRAALSHLRGKRHAEEVRSAFIDAAKEADLLVPSTDIWTEFRPGLYEVRLNERARFLVTQAPDDHYDVLLPAVGWRKCESREEVEHLCRGYHDASPADEEDPDDASGIPSPESLGRWHNSRVL